MQFTSAWQQPGLEAKLARWSLVLQGSSMLIVAIFIALAFAMMSQLAYLPLAIVCLSIYLAQFYYLGAILKYPARLRLRIWAFSLFGHLFLFGVVFGLVGQLAVSLALLVPELVSAVLHVFAIRHAIKALQTN